jgi:hypothetical protein
MGRKSGKMLRIGSVQRQKRSSSNKDMIILVLRTVSRWVGVCEGNLCRNVVSRMMVPNPFLPEASY